MPWFDREANDAVLFGFLTAWLLGEVGGDKTLYRCKIKMLCKNESFNTFVHVQKEGGLSVDHTIHIQTFQKS